MILGQRNRATSPTDRAAELAGNALRHGQPPTVVALLRADGHLIIDVIDNDPTSRPTIDPDRPAGTGLPLTQRLAQDVGWYPTDTDKHVWAQSPSPPTDSEPDPIAGHIECGSALRVRRYL